MKPLMTYLLSGGVILALFAGSKAQDQDQGQGQGRDGRHMGPPGDHRPPMPPPHPLFIALDLNKDGEISADEIAKASESLKTLDKNGDGKLTREELRPQRPEGGPDGGPGGGPGGGPRRGPGGPDGGGPKGPRPPGHHGPDNGGGGVE